MQYKLVIFDWDGTLMDSVPKIVNVLKLAAKQCGATIPSDDDAKSIIGLSLPTAVAELFPNNEDKWEALAQAYKTVYKEGDNTPTPLFSGANELLDALAASQVQLAVATGKSRTGLNRLMAETSTEDFFVTTKTADEAQSKPNPDMLNQILTITGVAAEDAIMIGDSLLDIEMAKQAGVAAVGLTHGAATRAALEKTQALAVLDNLSELHTFLLAEQHIDVKAS
jgi:phosphoglycolate phosphatase